jgi:hypothetical protein
VKKGEKTSSGAYKRKRCQKTIFTKFKEVIFEFFEITLFHQTCGKKLFPRIMHAGTATVDVKVGVGFTF